MASSFVKRGGRQMTPVHPGGPSRGRSRGASHGTSPGTSPGGSSAASTGHFRNHLSPIFTRGDLGTPTPSPEL
jgi:hypothetical protein